MYGYSGFYVKLVDHFDPDLLLLPAYKIRLFVKFGSIKYIGMNGHVKNIDDMVTHICDHSPQKADTESFLIRSHPGFHNESLS